MFVNPVPLDEDELEFARLMAEPPLPYSEALAFRARVEADEEVE